MTRQNLRNIDFISETGQIMWFCPFEGFAPRIGDQVILNAINWKVKRIVLDYDDQKVQVYIAHGEPV